MSRKFGLLGRKLGHSFSKDFFTRYFEINGIEASYENVEIETIEDVKRVLESDYSGLNVTVPYKESILPYLDELSREATQIGAVNVIKFEDNRIIGHNSDAFGFHQSIKPFLLNVHERAILLGTGGASKAVKYVLQEIGLDVIQISRNPVGERQFGYEEVNEHMLRACKLVVQCTPVGMYPDVTNSIPFPFEFLSAQHLVVDLIYNPEITVFLQNAQQHGATILNGSSMLKEQALRAWELWNS
ncbi:MAG: shikimate dehydrogenase [Bacteroidota bacterium]|jgi:shikimate dehydrogenase